MVRTYAVPWAGAEDKLTRRRNVAHMFCVYFRSLCVCVYVVPDTLFPSILDM